MGADVEAGGGAVAGAGAGAGVAGTVDTLGRTLVPSKWPQYPLASTASWKQIEKTAQFRPDASSFGTLDGSVSAREVAVTEDMMDNEMDHRGVLRRETRGPITCKNTRYRSVFVRGRNTDIFT